MIGTRSSKLALWQANHIKGLIEERFPEISVELKHITTKGDKILDVPLAKIGGKGLFTKELESEMLTGSIDLAVHSLKDMPTELPPGLVLAAITKRENPLDAFVSNNYDSFAKLPQGAKVGTSSLRRKAQLLSKRPDLEISDLRGNVDTRLGKLDNGGLDAIILAAAGLKRLGYDSRITEVLPEDICLPAVGQGALAVEARSGDKEVLEILSFLHDECTGVEALAERAFLREVEGGCQVPVGVHALCSGETVSIKAIISSLDGKKILKQQMDGASSDAEQLGRMLARKMLLAGGKEIMAQLGAFCKEQ